MERYDGYTFYIDDVKLLLGVDGEEQFEAIDNASRAAEIFGIKEAGVDAIIRFIAELKEALKHDLISLYNLEID